MRIHIFNLDKKYLYKFHGSIVPNNFIIGEVFDRLFVYPEGHIIIVDKTSTDEITNYEQIQLKNLDKNTIEEAFKNYFKNQDIDFCWDK